MFRTVPLLWLLSSLCLSAALAAEDTTLTLPEALAAADRNNPDLLMLAAEVDAAAARLVGASLVLRSNPTLTATSGPRESPLGRSRDDSFEVQQSIEIGGQRGARKTAAQATLDATRARLDARRVEIAASVRETFARALAAQRREELAAEAQAVAEQGVSAAQERFEAGAAALLEVNTARVELGRMARDRAEAERRSAAALGELHLLLGLDPARATAVRGELAVEDSPVQEAELIERALASRPEIGAQRRELDAARAEARLASLARIPTPRLGASFTREEESDTEIVQGILSFDVPLFNRNQEARGVAAANVVRLETALERAIRQVRQEVVTALARLRAARVAADGYASDVVAAMEANMELATESHRAGKIDFLQLLLIRRQALEARNEHIDVLEELNSARAQLDRAVGWMP